MRLGNSPRDIPQSAEFALLVDCCREAAEGQVRRSPAIAETIDWELFLRLVDFHRVAGIAWRALAPRAEQIPDSIAARLLSSATEVAAANLHRAVAARDINAQFARSGIDLLFVKGLVLGKLLYGDLAAKSSIDIDMLVNPADVPRAAFVLDALGYSPVIPAVRIDQIPKWHALHKESVWVNSETGIPVDLHTRLADNGSLIPGISADSPRMLVEVAPKIRLPTIAPEQLFAHLCVHGSSSLWFRLTWITDVAAFLHGRSGGDISTLYEVARKLGTGRAADQALLLSDCLFGSLRAVPDLARKLRADPLSRSLFRFAYAQVVGRREPQEPTSVTLGTLPIHLTQFMLMPGLKFKLGELVRQGRLAMGALAEA